MPRVSVVMSVYNGERHLSEAIESILVQTFSDFEFIIIDDGSTDGTPTILKGYNDARIVLIRNQRNIGLACSLNKGLALAQGEYVARMDADDVALPHRFEMQAAFLERHPEIGILGSGCRLIDSTGLERGVYWAPALSDLHIRWTSLLRNPFWHPTVTMRRDVLVQNGLSYDETFQTTQDYELWTRLLKFTRGANLGELLIRYRLSEGLSSKHREMQLGNHDIIALRTIHEQLPGFIITQEQVSHLRALFVGESKFAPEIDVPQMVLVNLYLNMLEAFMSRYAEAPGLRMVQRLEALKIARFLLHRRFEVGWIRVVRRLFSIDRGLPYSFFVYVSKAIGRRLGQRCSDTPS
jgi:glycosyltransferase involved in cell wall biosynthesis